MVDRAGTTATVWLGTTLACAQCHNHKYDPVSQTEYYQLYAFCNSSVDNNSVPPLLAAPTPQQQVRLRELVRDLENTVFNGGKPVVDPQGSGTARRTMKGIIQHLASNVFRTGDSGFPTGNDLDEAKVNYVLRKIWELSSGNVDLIVVGGFQKRKINAFCSDSRSYGANDKTFTDMVGLYESDFGVCRVLTTRWMPQDAALFLDSSRISVLPLTGRSFHFKPLASGGDYECGELIGEYTLELRNEAAHGLVRNLSTN